MKLLSDKAQRATPRQLECTTDCTHRQDEQTAPLDLHLEAPLHAASYIGTRDFQKVSKFVGGAGQRQHNQT